MATCLVGPVGPTGAGRTTLVNLMMRFWCSTPGGGWSLPERARDGEIAEC